MSPCPYLNSMERLELLEAFPEKGVFAGEHASFTVFDGDQQEAVVTLELEPADVVCALTAGDEIVFEVVGDSAGLGIDGVGAEIGGVGVKGGGFFFGGSGEQSFCVGRKRFAIGLEDDVDTHTARRVVHDQAGGPVIKVSAAGRIAFDGDQSPSANKLPG